MIGIDEWFPKEGFIGDLEVHLLAVQTNGIALADTSATYIFNSNPTVQIQLPIDMVKSVVKQKPAEETEPESVEESEQQLKEQVKEHLEGRKWDIVLDRVKKLNDIISKDNEQMEDFIKSVSEERSKQAEKEHAEYLEKTMKEFHKNLIKYNDSDEIFTVDKAIVDEITQTKKAVDDYYTRLRNNMAIELYRYDYEDCIIRANKFIKRLKESKL